MGVLRAIESPNLYSGKVLEYAGYGFGVNFIPAGVGYDTSYGRRRRLLRRLITPAAVIPRKVGRRRRVGRMLAPAVVPFIPALAVVPPIPAPEAALEYVGYGSGVNIIPVETGYGRRRRRGVLRRVGRVLRRPLRVIGRLAPAVLPFIPGLPRLPVSPGILRRHRRHRTPSPGALWASGVTPPEPPSTGIVDTIAAAAPAVAGIFAAREAARGERMAMAETARHEAGYDRIAAAAAGTYMPPVPPGMHFIPRTHTLTPPAFAPPTPPPALPIPTETLIKYGLIGFGALAVLMILMRK